MRTNFSFKGLSSANNARHLFIALLFSCFFMLLSYVQYGQYCDTDHSQPPQAMGGGGGSVPTPCNSHLNYIPDDYAPTLIVRLNFQYFYYSQSNPQNFMPTWDGVDAANPTKAQFPPSAPCSPTTAMCRPWQLRMMNILTTA